MSKRLAVIALAFAAGSAWPNPASRSANSCESKSAASAIQVLRTRVKVEHLYSPWATEQCLRYDPEQCDSTKVDIVIREAHDPECGGDPATRPVIDRFRVHTKSKKIERYNVSSGEYGEFSKIHSIGRR